jgi:hypothetical protein
MPKLALCLVIAELGGGGGPVDPGYGIDEGGGINHPWLPGMIGGGPVDPGYGQGRPRPPHVGNWVPGSGFPHPGNRPPGSVTLPTHPIYRPDKPVPPGQSPGAGLWVIAYIPGKGLEWVSVTPGVPEKPQPPPVDPTAPTVPVEPTPKPA